MQTTFPELASSMGKVIPLASALKVKQEELFGAMSTLTGVTGNTAEVSTQLRGVFQGFMKPTSEMSAALEKMGYKTGAAALESLGFEGALGELKKAVGGNETELVNMFGSVEAGTAVLALTGSQADKFTEKNKAMADAAGATSEAFAVQQATVDAMMKKMNASFDVVMITLGEKLLPVFNEFLSWVIEHMPEIQEFIDKAMKVVGNVLTTVGGYIKENLIPIFVSLFDWLQTNMPEIQKFISDMVDYVVPRFREIADLVKDIADKLFPSMKTGSFDLQEAVIKLTKTGLNITISALTWIRDNIPLIKGVVIALTTVWIIQKGIVLAHNIALLAHNVQLLIAKARDIALTTSIIALYIAQGISNGITWLGVTAQAAFNLVMSLNPIALVVLALAALGLAIYAVVKHWKDIVTWIKKAWDWLKIWNKEPVKNKESTVNTKYTSSGSSSQYGGVDHNARGTNNFGGGLTWVGEEGPELIDLPKGSKVHTNKDSIEMAKGKSSSGLSLYIENFVNNRKEDTEELMEEMYYYIKKKELGGA